MKFAVSSVYGDFSKTAIEIKALVRSQRKVDFHYLSYPEQLTEMEKRRKQGIADRKRKSAENKVNRTKRVYRRRGSSNTSFEVLDDDLISTNSTSRLFDNDDDFFIDSTINKHDAFEETYINPSTGMIMIGGMGGVDAGGHFWGENDSFDTFINDSSLDDTFSSFDESNDCFSCNMDEY
jgi:hypothetical protein